MEWVFFLSGIDINLVKFGWIDHDYINLVNLRDLVTCQSEVGLRTSFLLIWSGNLTGKFIIWLTEAKSEWDLPKLIWRFLFNFCGEDIIFFCLKTSSFWDISRFIHSSSNPRVNLKTHHSGTCTRQALINLAANLGF